MSMIEGHGDDLYKYGNRIRHNFSTNICQNAINNELIAHLAKSLTCISNYPEPAPTSVEKLLSAKIGVPADCIMATNGAVEAIYAIARAHAGVNSAILQPTFSEYADACRISNHSIINFYNLQDLPSDIDMAWICNPNNPTGRALPSAALQETISTRPDVTFVIDQAYHAYTKCEMLTPAEAVERSNLILIYSMTKDYAIPGLRIGYAVSNPKEIALLKYHRVPWSVNSLAIEAAKFLLASSYLPIDLDFLLSERVRISVALQNIGISAMPSDTSFMLCTLPRGNVSDMKEYLAENYGILIRDASNFEGLSCRHFRIAMQTREENDLLVKAISRWMHS